MKIKIWFSKEDDGKIEKDIMAIDKVVSQIYESEDKISIDKNDELKVSETDNLIWKKYFGEGEYEVLKVMDWDERIHGGYSQSISVQKSK